MIDVTTHKPILVTGYEDGGGHLSFPEVQLDQVKALFDANKITYWVDEETLSMNGGPEIAFIELSRRNDPALVQRLLDSVP